jgi:hypothetical protein
MDNSMPRKTVDIRSEKGAAIIVALAFLFVLLIMTSAFVSNLIASSNYESSTEAKTKSFYIAEAGLNHAIWKLGEQGGTYKGESSVPFKDGRFDIIIEAHPEYPGSKIVISRARLEGYPEGKTESEVRAVVRAGDLAIESWEKVR